MYLTKLFKKFLVSNGIDREVFGRKLVFPLRRLTRHKGTLPRLFIVGAQKAGTTTLHNQLALHPSIVGGAYKESRFFEKPALRAKGVDWYRAIFPTLDEGQITLDSTPMMYFPGMADTIKSLVPDAKIVMLLRDPVKRAFSHYLHNVARKRETLSFEEAITQEEARITHRLEDLLTENLVTYNFRAYSYKERSRYDKQLAEWLRVFGADKVKVFIFEEYIKNPQPVIDEVVDWLDLSPFTLPVEKQRARNSALIEGKMAPETEARLRMELAPSVVRLREMLGRDLPWAYPIHAEASA